MNLAPSATAQAPIAPPQAPMAAPVAPAPAPALPDPKLAYDTLVSNVYSQAFFSTLASGGVVPATEKQASALMEMAGKLRLVAEDPQVKAAAEASDPILAANAALDRQLGGMGIGKSAAVQQAEIGRNRAAEALMQNPDIYKSVLSLKCAEAEEVLAGLPQA